MSSLFSSSHPRLAAVTASDDLMQRLEQLNMVGASLSAERDIDRLLESILVAAKSITRADGGTLYRVTEDKTLRFEIVRTSSLRYYLGGTTGNPVPFYPIQLFKDGQPNHGMVAASAALTGKTVNIADAYTADGYDFTGTRAFDAKTGYRSKSFLTVPMRSEEHTSELQSLAYLVCRLLLEKKKNKKTRHIHLKKKKKKKKTKKKKEE